MKTKEMEKNDEVAEYKMNNNKNMKKNQDNDTTRPVRITEFVMPIKIKQQPCKNQALKPTNYQSVDHNTARLRLRIKRMPKDP